MESTSCLLALKPSYSPIQIMSFSSGEQPSSALLQSRPGKHPLSAHLLSAHLRSRPGKAPTFRAHQSRPKSTPTSATRFREPPYKPAWLRETPYTTIDVFPVVSVGLDPNYPARADIPLRWWGLASTIRTLTNSMRPAETGPQITLFTTQIISTLLPCCWPISFLLESH